MSKEFPEAELVRNTYTIRAMDLPPNVKLTKRSMLRWFALSSGLITEKESRSTILDVLDALLYFHMKKSYQPITNDIRQHMKEQGIEISEKLLRYHLRRLIDMGLIRRKKLKYFFNAAPNSDPSDLKAGYSHHITRKVNSALAENEKTLEKLSSFYR